MPIPSPIRRRKPTVVQSVQCQHCRLTLNVKYQPHPSTISVRCDCGAHVEVDLSVPVLPIGGLFSN